MSEEGNYQKVRASFRKPTKKKVLKITTVAVVALMLLLSLQHIYFITQAPPYPAPPPQPRGNAGYEEFYHYVGGMVNTANGNLYLTENDMSVKAKGFNIEIIRTYNAQVRSTVYPNNPFGEGWTCNYFIKLQEDRRTSNVTLTEGDGSVHIYGFASTISGVTYYSTPAGKHGRLTKNPNRTWILRFLDGSHYNFDSSGYITNITDKNNNIIEFSYNAGKLISIQEDLGPVDDPVMYINLSYSGDKVINATDSFGRVVTYDYQGAILENVTDPEGNVTQYSTATYAGVSASVLEAIIERTNHRINFTYEVDQGNSTAMVKRIYSSMWNASSNSSYDSFKMYEFDYYEETGSGSIEDNDARVEVTDGNGYTSKVYINYYGNHINITDPTGNYTTTKWDYDFNVIERTDKNNKIWSYEYTTYRDYDYENKTFGKPDKITDPTGNCTSYDWDFRNSTSEYVLLLNSITNKRGYTTNYTYDSKYNLNSTTDARGNTSSQTYLAGNLMSSTDFRGFTTNYTYNSHGNILTSKDPGGNTTTYTYDSVNRLYNVTDPRGYVTTYEYDDLDRIVKITDALENYTTFSYDEMDYRSSVTDANGYTTSYEYNYTVGKIKKIIDATGNETTYSYDSRGNKISETNARGYTTSYEYDSLNRLTKTTDARGNYSTYTWDENSNLKTVTNRRGYTTTYYYDELNRRTKVTDALGNSTEYTYDEEGNLKTEKNGRGYITTFYYNEVDRLIQINDASNNNTYYFYDENGNIKIKTDPSKNSITYYYDALNRLISIKDALNCETKYTYDSNNNKLNETDSNGNITKFSFDPLNRIVSTTDANNNVTYYSYDSVGRLLNITDALNHKAKMEYDILGRLTKIISPSGNETEYNYDSIGDIIERRDANNLSTYYEYNELNNLVKITYPDNNTIILEYDEEGNGIKLKNNAGFNETTYYLYNKIDLITSIRVDYGSFNKYMNYTYDEVGNRITMIDSEGGVTSYCYDALDRPINCNDSTGNITSTQWDYLGRRTKLIYPNGAYVTYSYDDANRLTLICYNNSNNTSIAKYFYKYDNVGNILNFSENDENYTVYTYDNLYRIINVSYSNGNWTSFTYDGVGNRLTKKTNSGGNISYTYDDDNRMLISGSYSYKYDNKGNLINKTDSQNTTLYEYDYEGRLTRVILPDLNNISYKYSANGKLIERSNNSVIIKYLYDWGKVQSEMYSNGSYKIRYSGFDMKYPTKIESNNEASYYIQDSQETILGLMNHDEQITTSYNYDPFGSIISESGDSQNTYKFRNLIYDDDTKFYHSLSHVDYRKYTWDTVIYDPDLATIIKPYDLPYPLAPIPYVIASFRLTPATEGGQSIEISSPLLNGQKVFVVNLKFQFQWDIIVGKKTNHWIEIKFTYTYKSRKGYEIRVWVYTSGRRNYCPQEEEKILIDKDSIMLDKYKPDTTRYRKDSFNFLFTAAPKDQEQAVERLRRHVNIIYAFWV